MTTHKQITVTNVDGVAHVRFISRRITDPDVIHGLGEELLALFEKEGRSTILLDFSDVGFLSSAAIGKLIKLNNRVQAGKGQLRLAAIRPEIFEVFRLLKLDETFHIHDTVDEALQAY